MITRFKFILILLTVTASQAIAQPGLKTNASEIELAIQKLHILGSVLYIAAHPDDENTRLITYFTKEKLYRTAYLSLTRGGGGQNLIGPELNELLGVIRTQELLEARNIDGGIQFFSRAKDFGFSKNPDETFEVWDKEKALADMVWVIRKFRPDVLITRFNLEPGRTHGHHTASAILAAEAFDAAADSSRFPEQLKYVDVWQPKRILWNTNSWFYKSPEEFKTEGLISVDVGEYNELLGQSYTEIAAESRSMHKSQGFGASGVRGSSLEYFEHLKGPKASKDIFEDINTSWGRIPGGETVGKILEKAADSFNPSDPAATVDLLLQARDQLLNIPDSYWKQVKLQDLEQIIKASLGLWTEAVASDFSAVPGGSVKISTEIVNRSDFPVVLESISFTPEMKDSTWNKQLENNIAVFNTVTVSLPENISYSHPYWLKRQQSKGMFQVEELQLIGLPENPPAVNAVFNLKIKERSIKYSIPVVYKKTDPVKGEQYRPFEVTPPVFINLHEKLLIFPDVKPKSMLITIRAGKETVAGNLNVKVPSGWKAEPNRIPFKISGKGNEENIRIQIYPSKAAMEGEVSFSAALDTDTVDRGLVNINYDHIQAQTLLPEATAKAVKLNLKKEGKRIGYIKGAGDEVPEALKQVGYEVNILEEDLITKDKLKSFDAVITGIRAFNTNEHLRYLHPLLLDYVKNGGTLIVQYNTLPGRITAGSYTTDSIGPYPFSISRDRVTKEEAEVRILKPEHPILNQPNKIDQKDFDGWVQERGLYFPNGWSSKYQEIISINDPGEDPKEGSILYAEYGKGVFIYTTLSWFRQLPAGVPGAYRLFVNLISAGQ